MKKTLKAQLFSAIAMMLVAAVALGTSTYAWFVNNAAPEVATMEFTATTSTALQIAVNQTTTAIGTHGDWKGTITNTDITTQGTCGDATYATFFTDAMVPATVTDANIAVARNTVPTSFFTNKDSSLNTETFKFSQFVALTNFAKEVKMVPLYFLANQSMDVYLKQTATNPVEIVAAKTASTGLELTVASMTDAEKAAITGVTPAADFTGGTYTVLADEVSALQAVYDAEFAKIKDAVRIAFVPEGGTTLIYEPSTATTNVTSRRDTTDYGTATGTGTSIATLGVDGVAATKGEQTTVTDLTDYIEVTDNTVIETATATTPLFTLAKDVDKQVKVYIWLEGTDYDCVGEIAKLPFTVNLSFIGVAQ